MHISEYLTENGLTTTAFGKLIGVSHSAVVRYANGKRRPSWPVMQRIVEVTDGAVTATDFFETEAA